MKVGTAVRLPSPPLAAETPNLSDLEVPERILIAEEDESLRVMLSELLSAWGWSVVACSDGSRALRQLQKIPVDVVLADLSTPGVGDEALLEHLRSTFPEIPVVAMTSFGSVDQAVAVTRAGAADYLTKPLDTHRLLRTIRHVLDVSRAARQASAANRTNRRHLEAVVGSSRPMAELIRQVERVGRSVAPVLVTGETGTGKEVIAQGIHGASGREPWVPVNCGAIAAGLLESELFGHARGAFTGADRDRSGLFEEAHGGTLFLDEIGELPLTLQSKLLRVLQFGELRRVGESRNRQVDVRIIAATHRDLRAAVREGTFREDLLFRIDVIHLHVPPLRQRTADIPDLAERILARLRAREARPELTLSPEALATLVTYPWPGNVRELQNVIERAVIMEETSQIRVETLPAPIRGMVPSTKTYKLVGSDLSLAEIERSHILAVLDRLSGNRSRAAEILGIPRRTLYRRLEEYGRARGGRLRSRLVEQGERN